MMYEECRYSFTLLDLGARWIGVVNFTPWLLYLRGKIPRAHGIGGWLGPRAGLDAVEYREVSFLFEKSNPGRTAIGNGYTH
jgi:hypothetical protein